MATYTENYNLKKPAGTDAADIADINGNMDLIDAALAAHTGDNNNPHSVTKAQVGLGNVPNVSTNDQTPTYTEASLLSSLESGEKLSVAFGKIKKAIGALIAHVSSTVNPHSVTKAQVGLGNVPNVSTNDQAPTFTIADTPVQEIASGETLSVIMGKIKRLMNSYISHLSATNPHNISKTTVGLGNVPNVSTNDQTPTYTAASSLSSLSSGEAVSTAFGKIAKAVSDYIAHKSSTSNPHSVTKSQVGLGNVPNVSTNNQTPTYTVATNLAELSSGEAMSTAFGKIAKAISSYINHKHGATDITSGILAEGRGGTGASSYEEACENLTTIFLEKKENETSIKDANLLMDGGHYLMHDVNGGLQHIPTEFGSHWCNLIVLKCGPNTGIQFAYDKDRVYARSFIQQDNETEFSDWTVIADTAVHSNDYIFEESIGNMTTTADGATVYWKYRMWKSGVMELWGTADYYNNNYAGLDATAVKDPSDTITVGYTTGSNMSRILFPISFVSEVPLVLATWNIGGADVTVTVTGKAVNGFTTRLFSPNSGNTIKGLMQIYAIGKWK